MKKNFTLKIKSLMKTFTLQAFIVMMLCGLAVAHDHYGQILDQRVNLNLRDVSLETALKEIETVTHVKFFYSIDQLNVREILSLEAVDRRLEDVLHQLLAPHRIRYQVHEREGAITLKREMDKPDETNGKKRSGASETQLQPAPVSGTVTDAATQQPMAGVNIIVRGTTTGTTTNAGGNFTIAANPDDILVFSFIGYKTREIAVGERTVIDLAMTEDIAALEEVEVYATGYDQVSPERSTGSYTQIGKELLDRNVGTDILSRLNGLTPALLIDQRSGQPFLNIRGRSTILANDQPLIVVDNFPYNGDISTINPNDIESITILKDAAAASIWGVRAGNGVIVITTRKGSGSRPLQVDINANITVGDAPDLFYEKKMSTSDFIDVEHMLFDEGYFDATLNSFRKPAVSPVVEILLRERNGEITKTETALLLDALRSLDVRNDLDKHFYRKSVNQQYAINFSGGSDKSTFFLSSGYDRNLATAVGNKNDRVTMNIQNTFRPSGKLEINTRLVYARERRTANSNVAEIKMGGRNMYPYARLTDDAGNPVPITYDYRPAFESEAEGQGFLNWQYNPLAELRYRSDTEKLANIRATGGVKYSVVKALNVEVRYQFETQATGSRLHYPIESYFARNLINRFSEYDGTEITEYNVPVGGILTSSASNLNAHNARAQLNFRHQWGNHELTALAGAEVREIRTETTSNRFYGYDPDIAATIPVNYLEAYQTYPSLSYANIPGFNGLSGTIDRFRSLFSNASWSLSQRYTLSLSARVDQSNLFGVRTNQKTAPLWSAGAKWNISEESFFKNEFLPHLSLRATYGYNGNLDQSVTAFTTGRFITSVASQRNAAVLVSPPNPELRWEKTGMFNAGLDFDFKRSRISGSIEYYNKSGIDLIGIGPLDPTKGFGSFRGNIASMKGYGWDITLNTINVDRNFKWLSNLLFSYTRDKVTDYDLTPSSVANYFIDGSLTRFSDNYVPVKGKPMFAVYSFASAGLDPVTGDPRGYLNGEPSIEYAAIHAASTIDSLQYHGPALPPVFGAVRNTFGFRGWSLSVNLVYRFGYYFRRESIRYSALYDNYHAHGDFAARWQLPGDERNTSVPSMNFPADTNRDIFYSRSDDLIERGDNIRIQDIRLSYELNDLSVGTVTFREVQIYTFINNAGLLWKANKAGVDPDFPTMPLPRSYALGLRMKF